jgi:hypothetical protein
MVFFIFLLFKSPIWNFDNIKPSIHMSLIFLVFYNRCIIVIQRLKCPTKLWNNCQLYHFHFWSYVFPPICSMHFSWSYYICIWIPRLILYNNVKV